MKRGSGDIRGDRSRVVLVVEARGAVTIAAKHVDTGDVVIRTERDPVETKNEV